MSIPTIYSGDGLLKDETRGLEDFDEMTAQMTALVAFQTIG